MAISLKTTAHKKIRLHMLAGAILSEKFLKTANYTRDILGVDAWAGVYEHSDSTWRSAGI